MQLTQDTYIKVPYSEKDRAKAAGARFDGIKKSWYIPKGLEDSHFLDWISSATVHPVATPPVKAPVATSHTSIPLRSEDSQSFDDANSALQMASREDDDFESRSFDFDRPEAAPMVSEKSAPASMTLLAYLNRIGGVIKHSFNQAVWIQVEVSKISNRGAHAYFDLVEYDASGKEIAKARGTLWASAKAALFTKFNKATGSDMQDGMKLLLRVKPEFNAQFGLSFIIEDVDPAYTMGDMQAKLKAIREALIKAGLYALNKKHQAPVDFTHVAVISPAGAAGLADFMRESEVLQEFKLCQFSYHTATFQGKDAPKSILKAVAEVAALHDEDPVDAIVIIRGGGAASDLAWLNDYDLAAAVCALQAPVFTGIGHQIDDTILDEVSFRRFDTPSKVSAFISSVIVTNAEDTIQNVLNIIKDTHKAMAFAETKLDAMIASVQSQSLQVISQQEAQLDYLLNNIKTNANHSLEIVEQQLKTMLSEVIGMSPKKTLERGYAVIRDGKGKPISKVANIAKAKVLEIEMQDGRVKVAPL